MDDLQDDAAEIDEVLEGISDKIGDSLSAKLISWFIRTALGHIGFGMLWYFNDWGFWLFWGYTILSTVSLVMVIYFHYKLVEIIVRKALDETSDD